VENYVNLDDKDWQYGQNMQKSTYTKVSDIGRKRKKKKKMSGMGRLIVFIS